MRQQGETAAMGIVEYGYAPVLEQTGLKPILHKRFIRSRRKTMIQDVIANFYGGKRDWKYCRKMGWRAVKIKIVAHWR